MDGLETGTWDVSSGEEGLKLIWEKDDVVKGLGSEAEGSGFSVCGIRNAVLRDGGQVWGDAPAADAG